MITICFLHALSAGHYLDFDPINGTFQNFNPVRRFLGGQIPYRDFQDYLGLGHLYLGTIMTAIFGKNYLGSLVAFSFLTFAGLALCSLMAGSTIFRKEIAAAFTNIVLLMLIIQPLFLTNALAGTNDILISLKGALGPGNSARFVRGMILPISSFLMIYVLNTINKVARKRRFSEKRRETFLQAATGLVAGFSFGWSNDYGISCWLCLCIMTFWVYFCKTRKVMASLKGMFIEVAASLISIFLWIEIFTVGHFFEWFRITFGTGGYQSWYFNSLKSYHFYDVDFSFIMMVQAGMILFYLGRLFVTRGAVDAIRRYGILAFANMACFCAVNEYKMLSGGDSREVALSVLFFTIFYELLDLFRNFSNSLQFKKAFFTGTAVISFSWCISVIKDELIFFLFMEKGGVYVEAMGGNMTEHGQELLDTAAFLDDDKFFATYASAQEVVSDIYQPTGTDYIIHVLGDAQRDEYLNAFLNGDFTYTATIKEVFSNWEFWIQRANWFFYRELYQNWHPVYANSYELYWERNQGKASNMITSGYEALITDIDDSTKKIIIRCNSSVNGIADVNIDYAVKKNNKFSSKLLFQTMIQVVNTGKLYATWGDFYESNYLRPESAEYIPIPIVNGYGEVTITSMPEENTTLQLNSMICEGIYTVTSDFIQIDGITALGDNTSIITVPYTEKTMNAMNGAVGVSYDGIVFKINDITLDHNSIYINIIGEFEMNQCNIIKLVRQSDEG